jgi:hypothetical protein
MVSAPSLPRALDDVFGLPRVKFLDRGLLPAASGLYYVLIEAKAPRLVYIGKADALRGRWTGHHREPDCELLLRVGIPVEIAFLAFPKDGLGAAEKEQIALFRPPLNDEATARTRAHRISIAAPGFSTAAEILQDFRERRASALEAISSDAFWEECNGNDGDLLCLWPYPDQAVSLSVHDVWDYRDNHPITPFRVPCPPAIRANLSSGWVGPKEGFVANSAERRAWCVDVALRVDAWLVAVAQHHAASVSGSVLSEVLAALAKEETLAKMLTRA